MADTTPRLHLALRLPPSDWAIIALLVLAVVIAGVGQALGRPDLGGYLVLHLALLVGFVVAAALLARSDRWPGVQFLHPVVTVAVVFTLYTSLGKLGVAAMPYLADAALSRIDTRLCGVDPSLWVQRYQTPAAVEVLSFAYGAFIPYINLSIALGCLGRPPVERGQFLTGWVFLYSISFLGYLFAPAHGPLVYHAGDYTVSLTGNYFYKLVLDGVEASGGLQGVFPSLHVGGSVYLCLYDLQENRLRGLTYLPLVLMIYAATIVLRYHYVIDLIAGTLLAAGCIPLGKWVYLHWAQRREAAGLPALPGREADALPPVPGAGAADAARLLPAD
jgi:hypothetical protein